MPISSVQGFVVRVDDIKSEIEELKGKEVSVRNLDDTPWGKFATVTDPDGNTVILRQE